MLQLYLSLPAQHPQQNTACTPATVFEHLMPSLHVSEHTAQLCELFEKVFVDNDEARVRHAIGAENISWVLQYKYKFILIEFLIWNIYGKF